MILQALKEYYDRKAADPESGIAPVGWERKEIPFVIVLDDSGRLLKIEDTREGEGKQRRARAFLVPQAAKKTSGVAANLLWDSANYVLGVDTKGNPQRARQQKEAFRERIANEVGHTTEAGTVLAFLDSASIERLQMEAVWPEILETNPNLAFRFADQQQLVCHTVAVREAIEQRGRAGPARDAKPTCLVTGVQESISALHASIKGVNGAQTSGANIVSFNLDAFRSFNKKQGHNAPVGERAAFAYTTAINTLLARDSGQRLNLADSTVVFWSGRESSFESDFVSFFAEPPKDDPDAGTRKVRAVMESVRTGAYRDDDCTTPFHVLGLAPNAARIAVRFWECGTIAEIAARIKLHFDDLAISKPAREPVYYSLWRLLVNVAIQDKSENIPPNLAGDFVRAILGGTLYPATLLQAALRRIRSDTERRATPVRAALLKAYLNRYHRTHPSPNHKEIGMSLDTSQLSVGYQLGRLFATLEKIQEEANPGLNATIRERYYGAACATPVTVFANLLRLKNHHLAKMESRGRVVNFERLLAEVVGHLRDFPAHLDLHEQGRFAIGYYHQRNDFFTKKDDSDTPN